VTWIIRSDHSIKDKLKKKISNSQPAKIIMGKIEKYIQQKKKIKKKKYRFEKNNDKIWKKNDDGWNWKIILINKKIRKKYI